MSSEPRPVPRPLVWWRLAEHVAGRVSEPVRDREMNDLRFERALQATALARAAGKTLALGRCAWEESSAAKVARWLRTEWCAGDRVSRIRACGVVVTIAALVALALQALEPAPLWPLSWVLPAACAAAGALAVVFAPRT